MPGHWKHDYIPLDYAAAESKFHGHVPSGWAAASSPYAEHAAHARSLASELRSRRHSDAALRPGGGAVDQVRQKSNEHLSNAADALDQAASHLDKGRGEEGRRAVSQARKHLFMYHRNRGETKLSQMGVAAKADRLHEAVMQNVLHGSARRGDAYAEHVTAWVARFNHVHAPAGSANGGQFASSGGSGAAKSKSSGKGHAAKSGAHAAQKAALLARAKADRAKAHQLEKQLATLVKQEAAAKHAAAKSAASAKAAAKHPGAQAKASAKHHTAAHHHHAAHHKSLKQRISALRSQIAGLLHQASQLDAQAAKL
jgi:hypothetical protein